MRTVFAAFNDQPKQLCFQTKYLISFCDIFISFSVCEFVSISNAHSSESIQTEHSLSHWDQNEETRKKNSLWV